MWKTAHLDTTIDVMKKKSGFIQTESSLPLIYDQVTIYICICEPTLGVVANDAWSTEATREKFAVQPHTEQCPLNYVLKHLDLYHIWLSTDPLSGTNFALRSRTISDVFFFDDALISNTARCVLLVSPLFIQFAQILRTAEHEQPTSHDVSETLDPSLLAITICPLSNSLIPAAFPLTRKCS
ncbi:hypothetical protein TNCV_4820331 [Trichonephila clavipes]|nr:hypothetical protein TNCV_4820331 [Trichonephila clavipes]